jgi:release factor glutamine methyltransferase
VTEPGSRAPAATPVTVAGLLTGASARLEAVSGSPRLDAELLLGAVLRLDRTELVLRSRSEVGASERARFAELVARRAAHEPVAYLLGRRAFRHIELDVDSRVLIPRPETELLVEVGLVLPPRASVLDVGTGSGAVALALADERPDLRIAGVDISPEAVAVAEANRSRLNLEVSFTVGNLLDDASPHDAVLANLPYVESSSCLPADVADFEPALALDGGEDGLDIIRRLVAQVAARPWPALLALEIGAAQGPAVSQLVAGAGFGQVEVRRDLAGHDRVVVGWRDGR